MGRGEGYTGRPGIRHKSRGAIRSLNSAGMVGSLEDTGKSKSKRILISLKAILRVTDILLDLLLGLVPLFLNV